MHGGFGSNLATIALLGVLLLLASAVGRVTATNMQGWLSGGPAPMEVAARNPSTWR